MDALKLSPIPFKNFSRLFIFFFENTKGIKYPTTFGTMEIMQIMDGKTSLNSLSVDSSSGSQALGPYLVLEL